MLFHIQLYFFLFLSLWFFKEREIFARFQHIKRKSLFLHISATKLVDVGGHEFHLIKEIEWLLFRTSILPEKGDQGREKKI